MDQRRDDGQRKRRNIHLSESDDRIAEWVAELTDGGNVSRLVRRLIREEAERVRQRIAQPVSRSEIAA